jgi:hypothetical protein
MALLGERELEQHVVDQFMKALARFVASAGQRDGSISVSGVSLNAYGSKRWCNADFRIPAYGGDIKGALLTLPADRIVAKYVDVPALPDFNPTIGKLYDRLEVGGPNWSITESPAVNQKTDTRNYFLQVLLSEPDDIGYRTFASMYIRNNILSLGYQSDRINTWLSLLRANFNKQGYMLPGNVKNDIGAWLTLHTVGYLPPSTIALAEDFERIWGGGTVPFMRLMAVHSHSADRFTFMLTHNGTRNSISDVLTRAFELHFP